MKLTKKVLLLIFALSIIVSHYATAYIFFLLVLSLWALNIFFKERVEDKISSGMMVLILVCTIMWLSQETTISPFNSLVQFMEITYDNLGKFLLMDSRGSGALMVIGQGPGTSIDMLNVLIHDLSFLIICIGFLYLLWKYSKESKEFRFKLEFILMMFVSLLLCVSAILLPEVSFYYGLDRMYFQLLIFLAPAFIIGGETISRLIHIRSSLLVIIVLLIAQFFSGSYLAYQVFGDPHSADLNKDGDLGALLYIHDQEVISAKWLDNNGLKRSEVYSDWLGFPRLILGYNINTSLSIFRFDFFKNNLSVNDGYIYLRYANTALKRIWTSPDDKYPTKNLGAYDHLLLRRGKIYDNAGSSILT